MNTIKNIDFFFDFLCLQQVGKVSAGFTEIPTCLFLKFCA